MRYRKFGNLDYNCSVLGFGCMRFPVINGDTSKIDEPKAKEMLRHAINNGVNYLDTAYPYHNGNSELFLNNVLKEGYREKVKIATKLPIWLIKTIEDCDKYLDEQLQNLGIECIDFYLIHALNKERWKTVEELNIFNFLDTAKKDGRIKQAGFSFHEDIKFFRTILDAYDWGMCQIQFNYMEDPAWIDEIKYAHSKGIAVVVMEPLLGGKIAVEPPLEIKNIWEESMVKRTPAEWALRWIYNHPEVSLVLSGMSTLEQVQENLTIAENSLPLSLDNSELKLIDRVKDMFNQKVKIKCTECGYCLPECPGNVHISSTFYYYNDAIAFNRLENAKKVYNNFKNKNNAASCIECGKCENICPQKLPIIQYLKEAHELLKD